MAAMHEPDREVHWAVGLALKPSNWRWLPELYRNPPPPWRGGWAFTWLFLAVQRTWKYI